MEHFVNAWWYWGSVVAFVLLPDGLFEPLFEEGQLGDEVRDGVSQRIRWTVIRGRLEEKEIALKF